MKNIFLFKKFSKTAIVPKKSSKLATGYDICSDVDVVIEKNKVTKISTGIGLQIDNIEKINFSNSKNEYYIDIQIRSRSGLTKKGIVVANGVSTIDLDYTGEIFVLLTNLTNVEYKISKGEKIAQIVFGICCHPSLKQTVEFNEEVSERKQGALGSTGKFFNNHV